MGDFWKAGIVILGSAGSQKGTVGGCCHSDLPLGKLYRDVVGIKCLKPFERNPWIVSSVAELYFILGIETGLHSGKNSQAFNRFIYTVC